jgi:type III secretion system FlhB-like substrate exporter
MDKKMHKITEKMKVAEKDIAKGKSKMAEKVLKSAEKKNEKLVKIDKFERDPIIEKAKKLGIKAK